MAPPFSPAAEEEVVVTPKKPRRGTPSSLRRNSFSLRELWSSQKDGSATERKGRKRTRLLGGFSAVMLFSCSVCCVVNLLCRTENGSHESNGLCPFCVNNS